MTKLLADSNRASLIEIIEDNALWGVTPDSGRARSRRFTSSSISATKDVVTSDEIRDDRMVASVIETAAMSGGDINWEFAAGTIDTDLQRVLMGLWSRPMEWDVFRGKGVAITANNHIAISSSDAADLSPYFAAGRRIKLAGFTNPANNDYFQITSLAFAGGVTTITISTTTLIVEAGTDTSSVQDANDVVILKNNTIRFGNATRTIDSATPGQFTAAVAAKQLVPGQRIYVEGVGYEAGTLTLATLLDGDSVTISDGINAFTFEAQTDSDYVALSSFKFLVGVDDTATAVNLAAAINAVHALGDFAVVAKSAAAVVTVTNTLKTGGAISGAAGTITAVNFTGGNATLGGFYTLVTAGNDALTVDRDVPVHAAGINITIKASMLRNPGDKTLITAQSASVETGFQDVSQFFVVDGLRYGHLSIEVSAGAIIKGTTTTMGRATTRRNTTKLGNTANYTVLESAATEVASATANVGALLVDGTEAATAIQSIKFTAEGNLRKQQAVGSKFPIGIAAGRLALTGDITAYFEDGTMYDRFLDHETVSLAFPIVDHDKNTYWFTIPAFKVSSDPIAPGGTDQDVLETMAFTAFRDAATKCMIQIDRFSSTVPITAL